MKKNILFFTTLVTILSFTACDFINGSNAESDRSEAIEAEDLAANIPVKAEVPDNFFPDFIYDVGPRFNEITKEDLAKARSFSDFITEEHAGRIVDYKSLRVIIMEGDEKSDIWESGDSGDFTAAQLELLQSSDYSTSLTIWANYQEKEFHTGELQFSTWTPYLTVVPEKQANYSGGKDALKAFLRNNSEEARVDVDPEKLKPAKLYFTVTKNGSIENAKLDRSSGYPEVDKTLLELIGKTQGEWESAENAQGEKVDQELVVSFGLRGC